VPCFRRDSSSARRRHAYPDTFRNRHFRGIWQKMLVAAALADRAQDIQGPAAGHEKLMSGGGEMRLTRAKPFFGLCPIAGVQVPQSGKQACEVGRLHGMHDVQIERAQRGALKDSAGSPPTTRKSTACSTRIRSR
jgi:hypothetical protein